MIATKASFTYTVLGIKTDDEMDDELFMKLCRMACESQTHFHYDWEGEREENTICLVI